MWIQLKNTLLYIQYSCYDWISQKICFQEDLLHSKKNETFCPIHYMHTVTDLQLPDNKMQPGATNIGLHKIFHLVAACHAFEYIINKLMIYDDNWKNDCSHY